MAAAEITRLSYSGWFSGAVSLVGTITRGRAKGTIPWQWRSFRIKSAGSNPVDHAMLGAQVGSFVRSLSFNETQVGDKQVESFYWFMELWRSAGDRCCTRSSLGSKRIGCPVSIKHRNWIVLWSPDSVHRLHDDIWIVPIERWNGLRKRLVVRQVGRKSRNRGNSFFLRSGRRVFLSTASLEVEWFCFGLPRRIRSGVGPGYSLSFFGRGGCAIGRHWVGGVVPRRLRPGQLLTSGRGRVAASVSVQRGSNDTPSIKQEEEVMNERRGCPMPRSLPRAAAAAAADHGPESEQFQKWFSTSQQYHAQRREAKAPTRYCHNTSPPPSLFFPEWQYIITAHR